MPWYQVRSEEDPTIHFGNIFIKDMIVSEVTLTVEEICGGWVGDPGKIITHQVKAKLCYYDGLTEIALVGDRPREWWSRIANFVDASLLTQ